MTNLNLAPLYTKLVVRSFSVHETRELSEIESRLMHLGFMDGEVVEIKKRAPLFQEPFLVQVRGRPVALTKSEAELVQVEVMK